MKAQEQHNLETRGLHTRVPIIEKNAVCNKNYETFKETGKHSASMGEIRKCSSETPV